MRLRPSGPDGVEGILSQRRGDAELGNAEAGRGGGTYGQTNLLWDEILCGIDAGSVSTGRMKSETMPNNGDTLNPHSPPAQVAASY